MHEPDERKNRTAFRRTAAVLTISDKGHRGEREDKSGSILIERLSAEGFQVLFQSIVPDEIASISAELCRLADEECVAVIVTTGGTGVGVRDVTPEATRAVLERTVPGMAEAMRAASLTKTPHAMISRALVGIRKSTLIVNLPGSPRGALENLEVILPALPHALDKIQGDTQDCGTSTAG